MKELELFTVYMKEGGVIKIEINEAIARSYGLTLEELQETFNTDSLAKVVQDFINCLGK